MKAKVTKEEHIFKICEINEVTEKLKWEKDEERQQMK